MRVLVKSYGDVKIFYDKIFCYKRYHVLWECEKIDLKPIQVYGIMRNK